MFRRLVRFMIGSLAVIGLLSLMFGMLLIIGLMNIEKPVPPMPGQAILQLDLNGALSETSGSDPLERLTGNRTTSLPMLLKGLDAAASDPAIKGLMVQWDAAPLSMAQVQELRDAVRAFAATGRFTLFHASSLDSSSGYYLATAFDEIWLQPSGMLGLTGIALEMPYARDGLAELGIRFEGGKRKEYKSGFDNFTEAEMTEASREALTAIARSWMGQIVAGMSDGRKMTPEQARSLFDQGPFFATDAEEKRLVDKTGYRNEAEDHALNGGDRIAEFYSFGDYLDLIGKQASPGNRKVALIRVAGQIVDGHVEHAPFASNSDMVGAMDVVDLIDKAAADPDIEAILIRIDSPGGSYVGSDAMYDAVRRARETGKPVVASMGSVAASGGYFLAMGADSIIAQPGTLTGSIGVLSGKPVLQEMWGKLGITWDRVSIGENAGMWSPHRSFTDAEWKKLQTILDRIYADFVGKAAKARNMTPAAMDAVARGRVWSGADARRQGLVDQLGGYDSALAELMRLLDASPEDRLNLVPWDLHSSPFGWLENSFGSQALSLILSGSGADWLNSLSGGFPPSGAALAPVPSVAGSVNMPGAGLGAGQIPASLLVMENLLQKQLFPGGTGAAALARPVPGMK